MRFSIVILAVLALAIQNTEAFVKGSATTRSRPQSCTSSELYAVAKKKAATKKKAASKKKSDVETFRKPDFVAAVAERLDTTKVGAEAAVAAVLDTISDVSLSLTICSCTMISAVSNAPISIFFLECC
jgi:hypothetical protein